MFKFPPGWKRGSQVGEAICSCVFFRARTAGSKLHILWLTIVLKLLFPRDDGRRCRAGHLAGVKDQCKDRVRYILQYKSERRELGAVVICRLHWVHGCGTSPVLPSWVHRVRAVAIFCSAVHVTLSISALVTTSTFRVGPRTHDERRTQLGFTVLCKKHGMWRRGETETSASAPTQPQRRLRCHQKKVVSESVQTWTRCHNLMAD